MATDDGRKVPLPLLSLCAFTVAALLSAVSCFPHSEPSTAIGGGATAEAKAYLPSLELSDVKMQATENFMQQQVVEVQGTIANHGPRKLALVEVYCLFSGLDGREIHRERVPIVRGLGPQDARGFRLPFDNLPAGWNQAMPRLVVARISFAT